MTGINVVLFYSENIFASAGNSGISSSIETIIVGIVQFLASGVTPLVVDRLGRKILLIISGTGTAISLVSFYKKCFLKINNCNLINFIFTGNSWIVFLSERRSEK